MDETNLVERSANERLGIRNTENQKPAKPVTIADRLAQMLPKKPGERLVVKSVRGDNFRVNWFTQTTNTETGTLIVGKWLITKSQYLHVVVDGETLKITDRTRN